MRWIRAKMYVEFFREIRKRATRVRENQINVLINYMVDHRDFACGRFQGPQGKVTAERQWQQLAEILEDHGPKKSAEQWKKVWKDLKGKARAKNAKINAERGRTGNFAVDPQKLTDVDEKVLGIIGVCTSIPLFDGSAHNDEVSEDADMSQNIEEIEEPIIEVVVGASNNGNLELISAEHGLLYCFISCIIFFVLFISWKN
ncbi:uncharacterized protein LOC124171811 isoform X1 [Ischnura elegans]|uniref:uncharacterized protein LOC124171811 isoform X1 n=1 Tax=Ischnura elegans TaxID=197161 RepID=UPI001ED87A5D|nr:uncharacterized protein LOC124171811 isoform X1 [Ischnura elegans]